MSEVKRPTLTLAQWLLLERVARGESNHQIAVSLALAPWLVRRQMASIYGVLPLDVGTNKRAAAIAWYRTVGRGWREQGGTLSGAWGGQARGGCAMPKRDRPLLTPMQWRVLERMAASEDNAAIGQALGIKLATVTQHVVAIYRGLAPGGRERDRWAMTVRQGQSKRASAIEWYLTVGRSLHEQEVR